VGGRNTAQSVRADMAFRGTSGTRKPGTLAATATALIAGLVLIGWTFDVDLLKRVVPGLVAMNPMSAVAFLLAAVSLFLFSDEKSVGHARPHLWLARGCALLVALVGLTKLVAIVHGIDISVDQWLFSSKLRIGFHVPNVMAPNTAFNFVVLGSGLLFLHSKSRRLSPWACICALISGFESMVAVLGYAYGIKSFYGIESFIPMALHTAVCFLFMAYGVMSSQANRGFLAIITGKSAGGAMARRLLPAAILVPAVLGWFRIEGQRLGLYDAEFGAALYTVINMLVFATIVCCNAISLFRADSERSKAEQRLRRAHDELEAAHHANQLIMDKSRDVICTLDEQRRFVTVSAACETLWGYKAAEMIGRQSIDFTAPEDHAKTNQAAADLRTSGKVTNFVNRYIRKDGSLVDVLWSASWSEPDQLTFAVAHNITERARTEEALKEAKEEADRANRAKSEFLSRMSHELRTPMNAILGFAQLLELEELSSDQREAVGHILRGGRHLLDLINEVLDLSRIEAGRLSLSKEPVAVGQALREAMELVQPLAAECAVRIHPLGDCDDFILADRQRLKQVLLNLLSNAIKYNRRGGSVRIGWEKIDNCLRIVISDTGLGIPQSKLDQLFQPFQRLGAEQGNVEGTGLGLAVAKRLVEAMDGTMGLKSVAGEGSSFWVQLGLAENPLQRADLPAEIATAAEGPSCNGAQKVLCIEDNLPNLKLIERVLSRRPSIELLSSSEGGACLKLAREHRPNVILLDLNLPDMDGHDVLLGLRNDPLCAGIPVIVISADATRAQIKRLKNAGVRDYLTKPLDIKKFMNVLDQTLQGHAADERPQPMNA
jgi:PAS domain S-box-containing protein